ncbi:restriction endonuclease subunit S (plasmid) [Acinetobacter haemolyticus]|nr:restriction endonuclease subunit S [Acinetobacter haemolyticus]
MPAPKIRFKEFSENWGSKKIIELADYVDYRGKTPKKVESGVLLVTAKNIKQGYLDYSASQEFIEESAFDDVMRRGKVELNDVLITTEAPLGNVASVDRTDIALAQRVIKYRGKTGLLDNLFLKQKFLSESFQEILKSKATGGTVQGIKGSVLHQIPLIVPSKEEQTKIATFLSVVDEKISQLSQKLHLLGQYKQGMMQKLFSQQIRFKADDGSDFGEWKENKFGECINVFDNLRKPISASERIAGNTPYYGANGIQSYIDGYTHDGEFILIAEDGANDLINYPIQYVNGKIWVNNHAHVVSGHHEKIQNKFLKYRLKSIDFTKYLVGGGRAKLNAGAMKEISFSAPCLEEQTKIADFLSSIDQKIDVVSEQLEQAKLWKKGLLQQMFV